MTAAVLGLWTGILILLAALIGLFAALLQRNLEHKIGDFARRPLGVSWSIWITTTFMIGAGICVLAKQSPLIASGLLFAGYLTSVSTFRFKAEPLSRSEVASLSLDTFMFAVLLALVWTFGVLHIISRMLDLMAPMVGGK